MARLAKPVIMHIDPGSLADKAGLKPGERLMAINGRPLRDDLDFRFLTADEELTLTVVAPTGESREVTLRKEFDEELGIDFGGKATFDGVYTCHNNCVFCFVHQQPRGMRPTLTLMDDDFRLSYMHGNFITLVGISEEHWQRIFDQKLSPLYISVHATDDDLRAFLLGTDRARGVMQQLRELAARGIQFHTQVVAVPGVNDGANLDRTISDLVALGPDALLSISVVPVGLTKHRQGLYPVRSYTRAEATVMVDQVEAWQNRLLPEWGEVLVYPSDEWYILAGREVPPAEVYGNYDQLENGVGMVRLFLEQMKDVTDRLPAELPSPRKVTVATSVLGTETLNRAARWLMDNVKGLTVEVHTIWNDFYGHSVTVAGLILGGDFVDQLREKELVDQVVLPAVAFRDIDGRSLDNLTPEQISGMLGGVPVGLAGTPAELAELATGGRLAPEQRRRRTKALKFRHHGEAATVNTVKDEFKDPLGR